MGAYVTQTQIGDTEITGSGTANTWAMFTGAQAIGNSIASQNAAATIGTIAGSLVISQIVATTGSPNALLVTGAAHTTLTASTEAIDSNYNLSRTVQFATGAITTQRAFLIQAPTYAFVGASTITNAATLAISAAPTAGTNATITNSYSLWVQAGTTRLDGTLSVVGTGNTITSTATATGALVLATLTSVAHTNQTASTEISSINFNLSATREWATGAITTQREFLVQAPTYAFVGASTITDAATVAISGPPVAGTNATLTSTDSLWIQAGTQRMANAIRWTAAVSAPASEYAILRTSGGGFPARMQVNAPTGAGIMFAIQSASRYRITDTAQIVTQGVATSGSPTFLTYDAGAHTTLTALTEAIDVNYNLARTVQFATGAITTQRAYFIQAPTYAFVGASTITDTTTVAISGAPVAGTNATITNGYALWLQAGRLRMDDAIRWVTATAITAGNYSIQIDSGDVNNPLAYNVPTGAAHVFYVNGTSRLSVLSSTTVDAQLAATTGNPTYWLYTGGAHTGLTASAEIIDINYNLARTVQRGTGAVATQRAFLIQSPTYSFVAASTITNAATLAIAAAPTAGTNATITNSYSLWVQAGTSRLDGTLSVVGTGNTITSTATTTGALVLATFTSVAHTNQTASTQISSINFNLSATREWATGAITTQREFLVQAPTYAFVGASTITDAATVAITGAPVAGTNATITNAHALWVQAGRSSFDGIVRITASGTANTLRVINATGGTTSTNYLSIEGSTANNTNFPSIDFVGGTVPTTNGQIGTNNSGQGLTIRSGSSAGVGQFQGIFLFSNTTAATAYVQFTNAGTGHAAILGNSNIMIGTSSVTTAASATRTIHLFSGVAPTGNIADACLMYTEDVTAGNAALHTRAENSEIMYFGSLFGMRSNHALSIATNNVSRMAISAIGNVSFTPGVSTSGAVTGLSFTAPANTGQTASTEINGMLFTTTSRQWATGDITTQREYLITAPTYSFVAASTITSAATLAIAGPPVAGTNATISTTMSFWVQAGLSRFGGRTVFDGRAIHTQGADIASATNLTLGNDGNAFEITGTTTIDLILITLWTNGAIVTLIFNESLTVRHGIATAGSNVTILLAGAANFSATANDTLTLILSETTAGGQAWRELARTAI